MALSSTTRLPQRPWVLVLAAAAAVFLFALAFASVGNPYPLPITAAALMEVAIRAGGAAAVYLLAAAGVGRLLSRLYRTDDALTSVALQMALGLGMMLTLSHLLGVLGLMSGSAGRVLGAGLLAAGLALLGHQIVTSRGSRSSGGRPLRRHWLAAAAGVPAVALLLVAASNPPGWLWSSEGRGYDALSYHLQLPQEWLASGRIQPLEHNVYSFLPSYVEAAFYHLGVVFSGGGESGGTAPGGLLAGDGHGVLAAQWLHAGIGVLAAVFIAVLIMTLARRMNTHHPAQWPLAGALAGALVLSTPWVIVTGSLAYNDLGVVALLAAALIAAMNTELAPLRRGIIVGLLIGIACGIKPTALFFAGIPAGLALLALAPPRHWPTLIIAGSIAGLAMLAPWLIRNAVYAGNPVFPFAASLFGHGHWTGEQLARYAAAHSFDGTTLDRLRLLFAQDPADPAGPRHRGMLHPQWSIFFPVVLIGAATALASRRTRTLAALFAAMLLTQIGVWLFVTHLQSRFLLPLAVPGAALVGMAIADLFPRARLIVPGAIALVLVTAATSVLLFAREPRLPDSGPNQLLVLGPHARTGELVRAELQHAPPHMRRDFLNHHAGPEVFANLALPPGATLYLLGDATPLFYTRPLIHTTTWDRSVLAQAIADSPRPRDWANRLRQRGITHIMVNHAELERLARSGFLDPHIEPAAVGTLLQRHAAFVHAWPGRELYQLNAGEEAP